MSEGAAGRADWVLDPSVRAAVPAVEDRMLAAVGASEPGFDEIARWLISSGGKRLRPIVVLLAAGEALRGPRRDDVIAAAATVELIHVASLYHDDVMDRADLRRGRPSTNRRWSSPVASYAGTFILARAIMLVDGIGGGAAERTGRHCAGLCRGQLLELENAFNTGWSVEEHLEMLEAKTGELFVLAAALGHLIAGRPEAERAALEAYCRCLGVAFQLRDDVLDYAGSTEALGKTAGSDFREGAYTLPVLLCLARGDAMSEALEALLRMRRMDEADIARAIALVRACGTVEETAALARAKAEAAVAAVADLADDDLRGSLENLARLSVERMI